MNSFKFSTVALALISSGFLSITASATSTQALDSKLKKTTVTQQDCVTAAKSCLLQVTPSTNSHGEKIFNVEHLCDLSWTQTLYNYKFLLKEELNSRTFLGTSLCSGVMTISDMDLPFHKLSSPLDANDGLLLIDTIQNALDEISGHVTSMKVIANKTASGTYSSAQLENLNREFQDLLSEVNRVAQTTSYDGQGVLDYETNIPIFIHHGKDRMVIRSVNMTTGDEGLNIDSLNVLSTESAVTAQEKLQQVIQLITTLKKQYQSQIPQLKEYVKQDETITTFNLNEDVFVVKQSGFIF